MAQPVWVLSVDLQTKTATFSTGLADAARKARESFNDIGGGAKDMAEDVAKHSIDVRHSLGLVDNVLRGDYMRGFVDLIRIYGRSAIVMGALPLAAVAAGLALVAGATYALYEHAHKLAEEEEKLGDSFTNLDTVGNKAFRELDDQILKAQEKTAELNNDHLTALQIALLLIDHQSMDELVKSFGSVEKAADDTFKLLQGHWYTFGSGSAGASHALEEFKTHYENLVSLGETQEASNLLHGTLETAQKILALQKDAQPFTPSGNMAADEAAYQKGAEAHVKLKALGVGFTKDELNSQQALVTALEKQVGIETRVNELKKQDKGNAVTEAGNEAAARRSAAAKESAQARLAVGESALAADKATAEAQLTIHNASIEDHLATDLSFAGRERDIKLAANAAEIAALGKSGKDYQTQLKALNDKALEIQAQYAAQAAELKARASVEINERDLTALEEGIRQQIEATRQGTAERLAAINAGIREEEARGLQQTSFYRDLLTQRAAVIRQAAEDEAEDKAEAAREAGDNAQKMGELALSAEKQHQALLDSTRRISYNQQIAEAQRFATEDYNIKRAALEQEIAGLDKSLKDYDQKLKALQDKEKQLAKAHEDELTAIKEKAEQERNASILSAESRMDDTIAHGLTQSIMRHQTWAQTMTSLSNQVISGMLENALKDMLADDMTRERDAAYAARKAFIAGMHLPFPANLVAAPALAAGAFASVMAFETGTDRVPGVERGDVVPAMLTPGEGIVPGGVMDGLRNVARNGGFQQGQNIHVHVRPTYHVQTIDGEGMNKVLSKHAEQLQQHVERAVRKVNH